VAREEILKRAYELGYKYQRDNRNCAQSTVAAVQDALNMRDDNAFRAASGLAGGSAFMGVGNCGAYSGGVMIISSRYGRERKDFSDIKVPSLSGSG